MTYNLRSEIFFLMHMKLPSGRRRNGFRNLVGTSALAKEEANEAQRLEKRPKKKKKKVVSAIYTSLKHLQKFKHHSAAVFNSIWIITT